MAARGGARPGAGRKPKEDELSLIKRMDAIIAPDEVWKKLAKLVKSEDPNAIKLWLSYRHGQPKQSVDFAGTVNVDKQISLEDAKQIKEMLDGI